MGNVVGIHQKSYIEKFIARAKLFLLFARPDHR